MVEVGGKKSDSDTSIKRQQKKLTVHSHTSARL